MSEFNRPYDFEKIAVTDAAAAVLDADKIRNNSVAEPRRSQPAVSCDISVEDQPIRFRIDGGEPDQTTGHYVPAGTFFHLTNTTSLLKFRAVAVGTAVTANLQVTYYNG